MKPAIFLILAIVSLACGCVDSKNPLSTADSAKVDDRLIGTWRETNPQGETLYHVGLAGEKYPSGMLRIVQITRRDKTLEPPIEYVAFTTTLAGKSYLNVVLDPAQVKVFNESGWKADAIDGYIFVKYEIDGDKAKVWATDMKAKVDAINAGKMHGVARKENNDVRFTDSGEKVAKFIAAAGDDLWQNEPGHLERVTSAKK
jgi:hypothetical protein